MSSHSTTPPKRFWFCIVLVTLLSLGSGCASLQLPAIDPTGQSIFIPQRSTPLVGPFSMPTAAFPSAAALPAPGTCNPPQPYGWSPLTAYPQATPTAQPAGLFGGLCSRIGLNPRTSAIGGPPAAPPQPLMPVPEYGQQVSGGLAQPPIPQPIANRSFLVGSGSPRTGYDGTFTVTPSRMVAPVGSTVVLRAGICDEQGYLVMRQPIQWSLSPNSVGSIVDVDKTAKKFWRHLFHKAPEKESGDYAIGLTSTVPQMLDRGTPSPNDDIWLMRGQTWMSVTSASEGATHVTSVAPSVNGWNERKENATVYWVDGQWRLPPPAVSGYGGHTLVTNVSRSTTGQPVNGWVVRYQILGGTPAALDANGAQILEVPSDGQGNAAVAVIPTGGGQGTTLVGVQVLRPGFQPGESRIKIGEGSTSITWTDQAGPGPSLPTDGGFSEPTIPDSQLPPLDQLPPAGPTGGAPNLSLDVRGPVVGEAGREVDYTFFVTNTGNAPIDSVEVASALPDGLRYLDSSPAGGEFGDTIRWELGRIAPGQTAEVRARYVAEKAGLIQICGEALGAGITSTDCATTDVQGQSLSLELVERSGRSSFAVGDRVEYDVVIRNETNQAVNNVLLKANFDPGLEHAAGTELDWPIGRIEANETQRKPLNFLARSPGRHCVDIAATNADSGARVTDQSCIDIGGTGGQIPGGGFENPLPPRDPNPPFDPGPSAPGPTLPPATPTVRIRKTGPTQARVGDVVEFFITIQTDNLPATNFRLVDEFDLSLEPVQAMNGPGGEEFQRDGNRIFWQIAYLPPNKTETFQVNCRCVAPGERVCNRAIVVSDNGISNEDETCLRVVEDRQFGSAIDGPTPLPGSLDSGGFDGGLRGPDPQAGQTALGLDVRRGGPALQANGLLEYVVEVTNRANQADHNVTLSIETPEGTRFYNSFNPPRIETLRRSPDGRTVDFFPISTLRPGETMTFRVRVQQDQPNIGRFRAVAKSDLNPNTIMREER